MSNKLLFLALTAAILSGCAQPPAPDTTGLAGDPQRIVGIWAMQPLHNGIANVTEFRPDGKALLHPFNCRDTRTPHTEEADYRVADDGRSIHLQSMQDSFEFKVLAFSPGTLQLAMGPADQPLLFDYVKVDQVASRCELYPAIAEQARHSPYQSSDFVAAPQVPAHADMQRYLGKWASDGVVQLQVLRDRQGNVYLYQASDTHWHTLYNHVRWVGNALHFQRFVYSDQQEQFGDPQHKSQNAAIIQPTADGKMRYMLITDGEVSVQLLSRVD